MELLSELESSHSQYTTIHSIENLTRNGTENHEVFKNKNKGPDALSQKKRSFSKNSCKRFPLNVSTRN